MKAHIDIVDVHSNDFKKCLEIRRVVFIEGQQVPEALEMDGLDGESTQYLLSIDHTAVGTARVRYVDGKAKIERVAILSQYQGHGFGKQLMRFIIQDIQYAKLAKVIMLGSQVHAIPFYEALGFIVCSDEYMDAGIAHKDMKLCW